MSVLIVDKVCHNLHVVVVLVLWPFCAQSLLHQQTDLVFNLGLSAVQTTRLNMCFLTEGAHIGGALRREARLFAGLSCDSIWTILTMLLEEVRVTRLEKSCPVLKETYFISWESSLILCYLFLVRCQSFRCSLRFNVKKTVCRWRFGQLACSLVRVFSSTSPIH